MGRKLWDKLPDKWKAVTVLGSVFTTGMATSAFLGALIGLPARVSATEDSVIKIEYELEQIRQAQDRILCILEVHLLELPRICR